MGNYFLGMVEGIIAIFQKHIGLIAFIMILM